LTPQNSAATQAVWAAVSSGDRCGLREGERPSRPRGGARIDSKGNVTCGSTSFSAEARTPLEGQGASRTDLPFASTSTTGESDGGAIAQPARRGQAHPAVPPSLKRP
jgi:hypothetical protein